MHPLAH